MTPNPPPITEDANDEPAPDDGLGIIEPSPVDPADVDEDEPEDDGSTNTHAEGEPE